MWIWSYYWYNFLEYSFGVDPEPVYAKTYGVVSQKGKKKRASMIDLDLDPATGAGQSHGKVNGQGHFSHCKMG